MNAIELSRQLFEKYGLPMLEREFAFELSEIACGIAGRGSDSFGFDDEISRDHDFEAGFTLWLSDETEEKSGFRLSRAYKKISENFPVFNSKKSLYGTTEKGFKRRDLQARKAIVLAAAPTMLLSVHMNYYPPGGRTGAQVFYQKGSSLGRELAKAVQTELNRLGKRAYSALCGDYFLLRENSLPACIIECGFLSDAEEEKRLVDAEYQSQLAYAVFKGCISYLFFTA